MGQGDNQTRAENIRQMASAYGVKLRRDLCECYNWHKPSELESLVKEENLAQEVRVQGYTALRGALNPLLASGRILL